MTVTQTQIYSAIRTQWVQKGTDTVFNPPVINAKAQISRIEIISAPIVPPPGP